MISNPQLDYKMNPTKYYIYRIYVLEFLKWIIVKKNSTSFCEEIVFIYCNRYFFFFNKLFEEVWEKI